MFRVSLLDCHEGAGAARFDDSWPLELQGVCPLTPDSFAKLASKHARDLIRLLNIPADAYILIDGVLVCLDQRRDYDRFCRMIPVNRTMTEQSRAETERQRYPLMHLVQVHARMIAMTMTEAVRKGDICVRMAFFNNDLENIYRVNHTLVMDHGAYACVAFEDVRGLPCVSFCVHKDLKRMLVYIYERHKPHRYSRECIRAGCSKKQPQRKCGLCRQAWYCTTECQRSDWPSHKGECVRTEELQASPVPEICVICCQEAKLHCCDTGEHGSRRYCGKECQAADWKGHKRVCERRKREMAKGDSHGAPGV